MFPIFQIKIARMLLRVGADPNVQTAVKEPVLNCSINQNEPDLTKLLLKFDVDVKAVDAKGKSSLHCCAEEGSVSLAKKLLAAGANPNSQDDTGWIPLFDAMIVSSWEMVELLLDNGSDLSLQTVQGETAVHILVEYDSRPLARRALARFVEEGIDLDICTEEEKRSALVEAANHNNWNLCETLLEAGADVNAEVGRSGKQTVLDTLCIISYFYIEKEISKAVETVLKAGALVDGINPSHSSPLDNALLSENFLVVKQLLQANSAGKLDRRVINNSRIALMHSAVQNGTKDMATFIFGDAYSSGPNQDLQQMIYDLSLTPEASVNDETIGLNRPPVSLYRLCRLAVRATLPKGPAFPCAVDQLPLAIHVKDFIAMRP